MKLYTACLRALHAQTWCMKVTFLLYHKHLLFVGFCTCMLSVARQLPVPVSCLWVQTTSKEKQVMQHRLQQGPHLLQKTPGQLALPYAGPDKPQATLVMPKASLINDNWLKLCKQDTQLQCRRHRAWDDDVFMLCSWSQVFNAQTLMLKGLAD